jgi:hypothetical protein
VVDDLRDLGVGQAVGARDLEVDGEFVVGSQRDEEAQRDEAAVAAAEALSSP